jgi:hypothetical protein
VDDQLSWVYVTLPWATFLLGIDAFGVVRVAPPIALWAVGRPERLVADTYRARGADFVRLSGRAETT